MDLSPTRFTAAEPASSWSLPLALVAVRLRQTTSLNALAHAAARSASRSEPAGWPRHGTFNARVAGRLSQQ